MLLAEDNYINQEITIEMLNLLGAEVDLATNGKEALELIQKHPMGHYAVVFMDIQMPEMDGYEATEQIRLFEQGAADKLPIVAMTANAFLDDIKKCYMLGMNEHIAKPISLNGVKNILQEIER